MRRGLSLRVRPGRARVRRPAARTAAVRSTPDPTDARSEHRFRRRAARHAADPTPPPDREPPGHPVPLPARDPTPSSGRLRARRLADRPRRSRDGPPDEAGRRSSRWAGRGAPAAGPNAGCRGREHGLRTDRGHAGRRPAGAEGRRDRRRAAAGAAAPGRRRGAGCGAPARRPRRARRAARRRCAAACSRSPASSGTPCPVGRQGSRPLPCAVRRVVGSHRGDGRRRADRDGAREARAGGAGRHGRVHTSRLLPVRDVIVTLGRHARVK